LRVRHHHRLTIIIISLLLLLFGRRSSDRTEDATGGFSGSHRSFADAAIVRFHRQRVWNDNDERRVVVVIIIVVVVVVVAIIIFLIFFFSSQTSSEDERLEKANLPVDEDHLHTQREKTLFWQSQRRERGAASTERTQKKERER